MSIHSVGIIGYGQFGKFLHELARRFLPEAEVRVFSRRNHPDGKTFFSLAEAAQADVVILATAISELEEAIKNVVPLLGKDTVLVDVATVKEHPLALLSKHPGLRFVSTHPMFGPFSFKKQGENLRGLRLVIAAHTLQSAVFASGKRALESLGMVVIAMDAETHDRYLAETLFLTHYVGRVIGEAGFVRTDIDTVSFGYLMDAVESVREDTRLFEEVYRFNSHCRDVVARFGGAQTMVRKKYLGG